MTHHDAGLSPAFVETIAGLTAGSVATLVVHPLDIVKTRMQIHRSNAATSQALTTVSVIRQLARSPHPAAALYRGLTPNLLGSASSWASFFFFKGRVENAILALKGRSSGHDDDDDDDDDDDAAAKAAAALTAGDYFIASGIAGACTQALTNPVWVLKTRMLSSDRGAAGAYRGMWAGAARILRDEGWRGFYRGLGISLLGVSHGAVQFAVYDPLKQMYVRRRRGDAAAAAATTTTTTTTTVTDSPDGDDNDNDDDRGRRLMTNEATLVISSVSKLIAGAVTYPYQVIRSRLQNYNAEERFGRGIRGVIGRMWREEGWRGFYRGIIPGVVRVMPATWVTFLVYENTKFYLPRWTGDTKTDL